MARSPKKKMIPGHAKTKKNCLKNQKLIKHNRSVLAKVAGQ